jgi:hypothetical protein
MKFPKTTKMNYVVKGNSKGRFLYSSQPDLRYTIFPTTLYVCGSPFFYIPEQDGRKVGN